MICIIRNPNLLIACIPKKTKNIKFHYFVWIFRMSFTLMIKLCIEMIFSSAYQVLHNISNVRFSFEVTLICDFIEYDWHKYIFHWKITSIFRKWNGLNENMKINLNIPGVTFIHQSLIKISTSYPSAYNYSTCINVVSIS